MCMCVCVCVWRGKTELLFISDVRLAFPARLNEVVCFPLFVKSDAASLQTIRWQNIKLRIVK